MLRENYWSVHEVVVAGRIKGHKNRCRLLSDGRGSGLMRNKGLQHWPKLPHYPGVTDETAS